MSSVPGSGAGVALVASACILLLVGCGGAKPDTPFVVDGSGPLRTETRSVGEFTRIEADHGIDVHVTFGTPQRVELSAQENLLEMAATIVDDGRLIIRASHDYVSDTGITARVRTASITELLLRDGATGRVDGLDAASLAVHAEAGAILTMTGRIDWLGLSGHGAVVMDLDGLVARDATVELMSGVVARVRVSDSISGSVSDGVVLTVCGAPPTIDVRTAGGATVIREEPGR